MAWKTFSCFPACGLLVVTCHGMKHWWGMLATCFHAAHFVVDLAARLDISVPGNAK
jgi:hypothetical protein